MTNWQTKKLGELSKVQTGPFGAQLHEKDYVKTNGTPIITVENLSGGIVKLLQSTPLVSDSDKARLHRYVLREGDIVFSRVGSVDRSAYVTESADGWMFSGRLLRVRPSEKLDAKYLNYHLNDERTKNLISNLAVGGTMPSLNTEILNFVPIHFPEKSEQERIVSVLEVWDEYIEKLEQKIALKEQLKKGLMSLYFIPQESSIPLKVMLESFSTGLNPRDNFTLGHGNNDYITIKNISKGKLHLKGAEKVDDDALKMIARRSKLAKNDVIMASIGNVGEAYLLKDDPVGWNINESVFALKPNVERIVPEYLYYFLTSGFARRFFDNHITGSSFKSIKMKDLKEMPVNEIALDTQKEITKVLGVLDAELDLLNEKLLTIRMQKKYLLKNLITGTIRTPENLKPLAQGGVKS